MLKDVPRALDILRAVRDVLPPHVPTTISLRRGFDDEPGSEERFYEIVEAAWAHGYSAVRVHARTVEQKYMGQAHWPFLREVKRRYPDRTILGSGDVFTAEDAVRMLRETGVDIVWIARGAIGNPWIFRQAAELLRVGAAPASPASAHGRISPTTGDAGVAPTGDRATQASPLPPSIHDQRDALAEHSASRCRSTASNSPAGGCGRWGSSTAGSTRGPAR